MLISAWLNSLIHFRNERGKNSMTVSKANSKEHGKPLICQGNKASQKVSLY